MLLLSFCLLKLQNKNVIFGSIRKFFSKPTYHKLLLSSETYSDNVNKRYFMVTNVLIDDFEDTPTGFFKPSQMMVKPDGTIVKKPKPTAPRILLIHLNGKKEKVFLPDAEKFAKSNNLILEKVEEKPKSDVYRVVEKTTKYWNSEKDNKEDKLGPDQKRTKKIVIKVEMAENDVKTKINQAIKILEKQKPVSLQVTGNTENTEKYNKIVDLIKENVESTYKINQKKSGKIAFVWNISPEKL